MPTKILLKQDVPKVGKKGDIATVKPGYARNFLIPKDLAMIANKRSLAEQQRLQQERREEALREKTEAEAILQRVKEVTFSFTLKFDEKGSAYGSVSPADIVKKVAEMTDVHLDKHWIHLQHPLKEVGAHTVALRLKEDVEGSLLIKILAEETSSSS